MTNNQDHDKASSVLQEINSLLEKTEKIERLDIIHSLRIKYHKELIEHSENTFRGNYKVKVNEGCKYLLKDGKDPAGVYCVIIRDPVGGVILYPGITRGKSKTSGLAFRLKDHGRFLGKTPLTIFVPNWWIKAICVLPIEDGKKARELENNLWHFITINQKKQFKSFDDLIAQIKKIMEATIPNSQVLKIEIREDSDNELPFRLNAPPAGKPKNRLI
jgi:hypothetical protein